MSAADLKNLATPICAGVTAGDTPNGPATFRRAPSLAFAPPLFGVGCGRLSRLNKGSTDSRMGDLTESPQEPDTLLLRGEAVVVIEIIPRGLLAEPLPYLDDL
jgi:hypothetical protein